MGLRTIPSEISLADLSHRLNRLLQTQLRFSSELDMRSKEDPSEKEDRSQHLPSSDCFYGKNGRQSVRSLIGSLELYSTRQNEAYI